MEVECLNEGAAAVDTFLGSKGFKMVRKVAIFYPEYNVNVHAYMHICYMFTIPYGNCKMA